MPDLESRLLLILSSFNPWWRGEPIPDLPDWQRAAFAQIYGWMAAPPAPRALFVAGARQIGKTTLLLQVIRKLLADGVPANNILYVTFDHPLAKLSGFEGVLSAWRARVAKAEGPEYVFLDEAQFIPEWETIVKHQVDFYRNRRLAFTGSAMPLTEVGRESGVGRWKTVKLTTLSFFEYLRLKNVKLPDLPSVRDLRELCDWQTPQITQTKDVGRSYVAHFHEYLIRGGFPQTALMESTTKAQTLLREDIIDKVIKRDMTAVFKIRRVLELEHLFLHLSMRNGQETDVKNLCGSLQIQRPTVEKYISQLEATHLIYRLPPFGYGKDVLRGRFKTYLTDPAIASAVMMSGEAMYNDSQEQGEATEAAVLKHFISLYTDRGTKFTYWRYKNKFEVDIVMQTGEIILPCEVKYRSEHGGNRDLKGLKEFLSTHKADYGLIATKAINDLGPIAGWSSSGPHLLQIPAPLLCYWLGAMELSEPK